jgi:hypothetical protein
MLQDEIMRKTIFLPEGLRRRCEGEEKESQGCHEWTFFAGIRRIFKPNTLAHSDT